MSAFRMSLIAIVALIATGFGATSASAIGESYAALLYGGNEIDGSGKANVGDKDGYGIVTVNFIGRFRVCFTLYVVRIATPTAAHIHIGPAGVNSAPVITLTPVPSAGNPGVSSGCFRANRKNIAAIKNNPAGFYVNVHNGRYPGGAIRGQLF